MNREQIRRFVGQYIEACGCHILEKSPHHLTVKLSPEADKDLTNRPYYWSFVEKTGVQPETMTLTFVFDPHGYAAFAGQAEPGAGSGAGPHHSGAVRQDGGSGGILGSYLGFAPSSPVARIPQDDMTFGSRRLEQMFHVVKQKGRFVQMFENIAPASEPAHGSIRLSTWLAVNFKVELTCDMKRDELHSLAVNLSTGQVVGNFHAYLLSRSLTPRLPVRVHIAQPRLTVSDAALLLEEHLERALRKYDHRWADEAFDRWRDELARVQAYYDELLQSIEPDKREAAQQQYRNRCEEIRWQYYPRVQVSVINCGLFHMDSGHFS